MRPTPDDPQVRVAKGVSASRLSKDIIEVAAILVLIVKYQEGSRQRDAPTYGETEEAGREH